MNTATLLFIAYLATVTSLAMGSGPETQQLIAPLTVELYP